MVTKLLPVKVVQIVQHVSGGNFFTRNFTSDKFFAIKRPTHAQFETVNGCITVSDNTGVLNIS